MLRVFGCAMMLCLVTLTWAAKPAPSRKPSSKSGAKATAKKSASAKKTSPAKKGSKKGTSGRATTWRNRQMAPTPERYRQIQEALAAKGHLRPEDVTGVWNQTSAEALKTFQREQNIESNGKINSLSLIALGLGPKREAAVKPPPPQPMQ
jgi:Putative peptidoglycan binding domain